MRRVTASDELKHRKSHDDRAARQKQLAVFHSRMILLPKVIHLMWNLLWSFSNQSGYYSASTNPATSTLTARWRLTQKCAVMSAVAPRSRRDAEQKFRDAHLRHTSDELALRATILKPTNLYIGYCGLYPNFGAEGAVSGEAVLAFYLAREYWGRGLATEAGRVFIRFGFAQLRLRRIVATVQVGNAASYRLMEKLGFALRRTEGGIRSFHHFELANLSRFETPHSMSQD